MSSQNIENFYPPVQSDGLNTQKNTSLGGTLDVTGATTLSSVTVSGASTFSGTVAASSTANFTNATLIVHVIATGALSGASILIPVTGGTGATYYVVAFPTKT